MRLSSLSHHGVDIKFPGLIDVDLISDDRGYGGIMTGKVFISYRRRDSFWFAGRLRDRLAAVLGENNVFMDIHDLTPGQPFPSRLQTGIAAADYVIAVLGPAWVTAMRDSEVSGRQDFARLEIAAALEQGKVVVPVLFDGANFPASGDLSPDLQRLAAFHGVSFNRNTFDRNVEEVLLGMSGPLRPGAIFVDVGPVEQSRRRWLMPGRGGARSERFRDVAYGPELVVVPAGEFLMGSPPDEVGREPEERGSEGPQRTIRFTAPFAVGRFPITVAEFRAFVEHTALRVTGGANFPAHGAYSYSPTRSWERPGFDQEDSHPVVAIGWENAKAYVVWLSQVTGRRYRLTTNSEWEYAARAGSTTRFHVGDEVTQEHANFTFRGWTREGTTPVGHFEAPNAWGLEDVHGNVWEMCEDKWNESYADVPLDGTAWPGGDDNYRVARGGSWTDAPKYLRSAMRSYTEPAVRATTEGFRVVREL